MHTSELDILIQLRKYAKGELDEVAREALEAALQEQPELREELEMTRALIQATERFERQRILDILEGLDTQPEHPTFFQSVHQRIRALGEYLRDLFYPRPAYGTLARIAAALLVLVAAIYWFSHPTPSDSLIAFQTDAYISAPAPPGMGSRRSSAGSSPLALALRDYKLKQYQKSLEALGTIMPEDSLYLYAVLLEGHNYYKLGDQEAAIRSFNRFEEQYRQPGHAFKPHMLDNARWTRILAMLAQYRKTNSPEQKEMLLRAVDGFLEVANRADTYYEKAKELKGYIIE